jgi:hypothetical protein
MALQMKHVSHCLPTKLGVQFGNIVDVGNIQQVTTQLKKALNYIPI